MREPGDPAARLLIARLSLSPPTRRVLDLRCGAGKGELARFLVRRALGDVVLADDHGGAIEALRRALARDSLMGDRDPGRRIRLLHGDGYAVLTPGSFDLVCLSIPKGKEFTRRLIRLAAWYLRPGGRFCLAGPKRGGISGALAFTRELFGDLEEETYGGGCRAACAVLLLSSRREDPGEGFRLHEVEVYGQRWHSYTHPALFAYGAEGLDPGTRMLLESMDLRPGERVLDLGCGSGIVGLLAVRRFAARAVLVDVSAAALEASRRTLALYGLSEPQAAVRYSDVTSGIAGERFDVVLTYPPAHRDWTRDRETAQRFIQGAARVLQPRGRAYVVSSAGLPLLRWLRESFQQVETLAATGAHTLYRAETPRTIMRT